MAIASEEPEQYSGFRGATACFGATTARIGGAATLASEDSSSTLTSEERKILRRSDKRQCGVAPEQLIEITGAGDRPRPKIVSVEPQTALNWYRTNGLCHISCAGGKPRPKKLQYMSTER